MTAGIIAFAGWSVAAAGWMAAAHRHRVQAQWRENVIRACHEIRGPLSAVWLGLDTSSSGGYLRPERLRAVTLELERAAVALDDLQAGRPATAGELGEEDVDAAQLVLDCGEAWEGYAAARGVRLLKKWTGEPVTVRGDRTRLAQAVDNLLANAIEHGEGPVTATGRRDRGHVRIEVCDCGAGLPAPVAELTARARKGLGARGRGLAIASEIVRQHQGRLAAAPSQRGARLVLEVPIASVEEDLALPDPAT